MDKLDRTTRSSLMRRVRRINTGPELAVRRLLFSQGYRYRLHGVALPGRPDIVFSRRRCVIFVHGCFWHGHDCPRGRPPKSNVEFWTTKLERNRERDLQCARQLDEMGWRVLVVWQCELADVPALSERLSSFLG
ncbi:DNA mismatch endonuclease Vsr [Paraburkholderia sediminicola]|uniref:DNA mismatch endonuclease Vsr n=1 Tax=Paraburkholderia rhynchosiae TaxID=487049 RepID=A0ACC7NAM8_9BURK